MSRRCAARIAIWTGWLGCVGAMLWADDKFHARPPEPKGYGNESYCVRPSTTQAYAGDTIRVDVAVAGVDVWDNQPRPNLPETLTAVKLHDSQGGEWDMAVSPPNSATTQIAFPTTGPHTLTADVTITRSDGAPAHKPGPATQACTPTINVLLPPPIVQLSEVSFTGFDGASGIPLIEQATGQAITSPEWRDADLDGNTEGENDRNKTAAVPMATPFKVKAKFSVTPFDETTTVQVWAEGLFGGLNSDQNPITLNSSGEAILTINSPPQAIDYRNGEGWTFHWRDAYNRAGTAGSSTHEICVPHGITPDAPALDVVMILSCTACRGLATTPRQIADALYANWQHCTNPKSGKKLYYDLYSGDGTVGDLLTNGKSSCGAWARFFQASFRAQGLPQPDLDSLKEVGFSVYHETQAVNHAGEEIWKGFLAEEPGVNNAAAPPLGAARMVKNGRYLQWPANPGQAQLPWTAQNDTFLSPESFTAWPALDHAVCMLKDGTDVVLYDTSWGGNYILKNWAMPAAAIHGQPSSYPPIDPFYASYVKIQFAYLQGRIQIIPTPNDVGADNVNKCADAFVPTGDIFDPSAKPQTLLIVWNEVVP